MPVLAEPLQSSLEVADCPAISHRAALAAYTKTVLSQWAPVSDCVERLAELMTHGIARCEIFNAKDLRTAEICHRLEFREDSIDSDRLAAISLPLDPYRVRTRQAEGPVIFVEDEDRFVIMNGNHRTYKILHDNPSDHPLFAVVFSSMEAFVRYADLPEDTTVAKRGRLILTHKNPLSKKGHAA